MVDNNIQPQNIQYKCMSNVTLSFTGNIIFRESQVNNMNADVLASLINQTSALYQYWLPRAPSTTID